MTKPFIRSHVFCYSHTSHWKWELWLGSFIQGCGCATTFGWYVQHTIILTVIPIRIYKEVFFSYYIVKKIWLHSNKTCNKAHSQISFYGNDFKGPFFTVKHVRKCLPELESPNYIAWSCTTGGGDGDKTKHKGVTGGCCLHCITFPYPVGIFLLGWYKQQVSGCERGSFAPGGAQCFTKHWPGEI